MTKAKFCILVLEMTLTMGVALHASAQTWATNSAPSQPWRTIACSADGNKIVAAGFLLGGEGDPFYYYLNSIYTSSDSGLHWGETSAPGNLWTSVASSADAATLVAVAANGYQFVEGVGREPIGGTIYTSTNSGATWEQTSAVINQWTSVASSADGTTFVATAIQYDYLGSGDGGIYTSTNGGATWIKTSAPTNEWRSVCSSADGRKLASASGYMISGDGLIYTSMDSGNTWTQTSAPVHDWTCIGSSADGAKLVASSTGSNGSDGLIYTSADFGRTWTETSAPSSGWSSVASSADGIKLAAFDALYGIIYTSTNSGVTWETADTFANACRSIASSADGAKLLAACYDGFIYASRPYQILWPQLAIYPNGGQFGISWLVPSSSFVLQQNSDLTTTNWTDVATTPMLNLTNLNYQVTVSPMNGQGFYRLKQQ